MQPNPEHPAFASESSLDHAATIRLLPARRRAHLASLIRRFEIAMWDVVLAAHREGDGDMALMREAATTAEWFRTRVLDAVHGGRGR